MDAKNVSAAKPKIGGSVFVAPLGTKLPEDDGVSNNNSPETDTQKAWGGAVVLNLFSGKEDTFKLKLIESLNINVLKTVYGSSNVTGDLDTGLTIKAKNEEPEQFSWVIDMILKGKILKRLVIPCAGITEIGEIKYSEITFSGVPDETETSHYDYMIKKKEGE